MDDDTLSDGWFECFRSIGSPFTIADFRAISIPMSPTGVTAIPIANPEAGPGVTLLPATNGHEARLTGGGALVGNYAISLSVASAIAGDTFWVSGNQIVVTVGAFNLTVDGLTIPAVIAGKGNWLVKATYNGATYDKILVWDVNETEFITNSDIAANTIDASQKLVAASITSTEMGVNSTVTANYTDLSVTLPKLEASVQATLAAFGQLKYASVSISSAEILALNGTPIDIVAAPGAGVALVPCFAVAQYTFATIAYAVNTSVSLVYSSDLTASHRIGTWTAILAAAAPGQRLPFVINVTPPAGYLNIANDKIQVYADTGNPAAGDGTLKIYLWYYELTL